MLPPAADELLDAPSPAPRNGDKALLDKRRRLPKDRPHIPPKRPTSFFLKSEEELEQSLAESSKNVADSTYGVESLEDAIKAANLLDARDYDGSSSHTSIHDTQQLRPRTPDQDLSVTHSADSSPNRSPRKSLTRPSSVNTISLPLTPVFAHSPNSGPLSTPRSTSLRSFKLSDDESGADDTASQAIASSGEEDEDEVEGGETPGLEPPLIQSSHEEKDDVTSQLIMPSIKMPTRRPFTEIGRQLGKLKILVAGASGVGKTSLIQSIVQTCEHIVHVDPIATDSNRLERLAMSTRRLSSIKQPRLNIGQPSTLVEINASTRAYPGWWSDLDEGRILKRRRSNADTVLERNLTFIDTPGFDQKDSSNIDVVLQHVEALMLRNASFPAVSDSEILNILSGNGGVQVDLALYLCNEEPSELDKSFISRLSRLTNVLPVIGKSDLISTTTQTELKSRLSGLMADPRPVFPSQSSSTEGNHTYVISSLVSSDDDMDASLMMSPDYIQPLVPSDLPLLLSRLFHPETSAYLRHTAARKFLTWRTSTATPQTTFPPSMSLGAMNTACPALPYLPTSLTSTSSAYTTSSVIASSVSPSAVLITNNTSAQPAEIPAYTLARLADHTQREERLAQARLARWAADLQRALANERRRYAALTDADRRAWLEQRMGEVVDGANDEHVLSTTKYDETDTSTANLAASAIVRSGLHHSHTRLYTTVTNPSDPLGLWEWDDKLRRRGMKLVKILGGAGVVGALAVWCWRAWHDGVWFFWGSSGGSGSTTASGGTGVGRGMWSDW